MIPTTLQPHKLCELIPEMTDAEYSELREDIQRNGQLEAITLYEGQVLDGRHRARACAEIGIEPWTREYHGTTPAEYVIALNVHRRQLTTGQKAEIARLAMPALQEEAKARQQSGLRQGTEPAPAESRGRQLTSTGSDRTPRAADLAGELVGVSGSAVSRIIKVADERPDLHQKVKAGEMTVNAAYEKTTKADAPAPVAPPTPIDFTKTKNRNDANRAKERVEKAVGTCNGLARGLDLLNIRYAVSVSTPEEMAGWDQSFSEAIGALRRLRNQIKEETTQNAA